MRNVLLFLGVILSGCSPTDGEAVPGSERLEKDTVVANESTSEEKELDGKAAFLIAQLHVAALMYKHDWREYPPGDGKGSVSLANCLKKMGPKELPYFHFKEGMLDKNGNVLNPARPGDSGTLGIIHYRNNFQSHALHIGPMMFHPASFDMWCAAGEHDSKNPESAWALNNWE